MASCAHRGQCHLSSSRHFDQVSVYGYPFCLTSANSHSLRPALFLVNRKYSAEALDTFYSTNTFAMSPADIEASPTESGYMSCIQALHVRDFGTDVLAKQAGSSFLDLLELIATHFPSIQHVTLPYDFAYEPRKGSDFYGKLMDVVKPVGVGEWVFPVDEVVTVHLEDEAIMASWQFAKERAGCTW